MVDVRAPNIFNVITPQQFASVYNDTKYANQQQIRVALTEVAAKHVGKHTLVQSIAYMHRVYPGMLLDRRAMYDAARANTIETKKREPRVEETPPEHRVVLENVSLKKEIASLRANRHEDNTFQMLWEELSNRPYEIPKWLTPKKTGRHTAIPTAFLSDCHFDEVVAAEEINDVNSYDREIATIRLIKFGDSVIRLCRDYYGTIFDMPSLVMPWGGDMIGGNIHEELKVTNADSIMGTVHYWIGQLIGLVQLLHENFERIHIPCVVGNHGRNSRKPIAKGRVRDNFDWLLYKQVEFFFHGTPEQRKKYAGITFDISNGTECRYTIFDTKFQLTHGDQFRGGQGWGGIAVPIMKGAHKKKEREAATRSPFQIMLLGHFHQLLDLGNTVVNGSLKGYDEYAALNNFAFEEPRQAFFLTDPKYGKTFFNPIHVGSSKETWHKAAAGVSIK